MAGYSYPDKPRPPIAPEPRVKPCCARCRRGVPAFGTLPCGYSGKCKCHATRAQAFLDKRAEIREGN